MEKCQDCNGEGRLEILGDGAGFEVDVIGYQTCNVCGGLGEVEDEYDTMDTVRRRDYKEVITGS